MSEAAHREWDRQFVVLTLAAWMLALGAITLRRVGVALVPSLIYLVVCHPNARAFVRHLSRRTKLAAAAISVVVIVQTMAIVAKASTLSDFMSGAGGSNIAAVFWKNCGYRLTEFGELFLNLPTSKTPGVLRALVPLAGILLLLLTLGGLFVKRKQPGPTEVFLIGFWLPVIPLLMAYAALSVTRFRLPKALVTIYCGCFAVLGLAAIAYST